MYYKQQNLWLQLRTYIVKESFYLQIRETWFIFDTLYGRDPVFVTRAHLFNPYDRSYSNSVVRTVITRGLGGRWNAGDGGKWALLRNQESLQGSVSSQLLWPRILGETSINPTQKEISLELSTNLCCPENPWKTKWKDFDLAEKLMSQKSEVTHPCLHVYIDDQVFSLD